MLNQPAPQSTKKRFPKSRRVLRHSDFERVYRLGKRHFAAHLTAFYLARAEGTGLRVGFTVGKALGGAVERNRMKRRLREAVRLSPPPEGARADVVINPKRSLLKAGFSDLQKEVERAFQVVEKSARSVSQERA